jgi:hypothetical protein
MVYYYLFSLHPLTFVCTDMHEGFYYMANLTYMAGKISWGIVSFFLAATTTYSSFFVRIILR